MRGCDHEDDLLGFVDFIEKAPGADPIAPGFRVKASELLDVRTKVRMLAQLGIDKVVEFFSDSAVAGSGYPPQVLFELVCLEDPVSTQRSDLSAGELPASPS